MSYKGSKSVNVLKLLAKDDNKAKAKKVVIPVEPNAKPKEMKKEVKKSIFNKIFDYFKHD